MGVTQRNSSCVKGFQLLHSLHHLLVHRNLLPVVSLREMPQFSRLKHTQGFNSCLEA